MVLLGSMMGFYLKFGACFVDLDDIQWFTFGHFTRP